MCPRLIYQKYLILIFDFPDHAAQRLLGQVAEAYANALAPGTQANRISQAKTFIAFMLALGLEAFNPKSTDILMYIQLLVNSHKTLGTIKNYLSGAKVFLLERGFSGAAFVHPLVGTFLKGVERHSTHVPQPAVPIPARVIIRACRCLRDASAEGEVVAACILFAFATLLRQCHLVFTPHGYMHMLQRRDVVATGEGMLISLRSGKTTTRRNITIIPVQRAGGAGACPVQHYQRAIALTPASQNACLFLNPRTGRPLSAPRANALFKEALAAVGFKGAPAASLHSLRRSGAHACARAGLPIDQVKRHGCWRSNAVKAYLPKDISGTPRALASALAGDA